MADCLCMSIMVQADADIQNGQFILNVADGLMISKVVNVACQCFTNILVVFFCHTNYN